MDRVAYVPLTLPMRFEGERVGENFGRFLKKSHALEI